VVAGERAAVGTHLLGELHDSYRSPVPLPQIDGEAFIRLGQALFRRAAAIDARTSGYANRLEIGASHRSQSSAATSLPSSSAKSFTSALLSK
jgi:hypothetical protein